MRARESETESRKDGRGKREAKSTMQNRAEAMDMSRRDLRAVRRLTLLAEQAAEHVAQTAAQAA